MGYSKQAVKGVSWVGLFRAVFRSVAVIRTAILARLLTPAQFGIFGIAAIVLGLIEMFTETGINVFLIQEDSDKSLSKYIDTAWVVSIIRGLLIGIFVIIFTPLIAYFFKSPAAVPLLLLISLVPIIRGFINPSLVNFQKQLKFNQEFWFRNAITLADGLTAIIIAYLYRTPVSLVAGLIAGAAIEVILSHLLLTPKPKFAFKRSQFSTIFHKGKWVTGAGVFAYFAQKLPDIVIARRLNTTQLGYYQMAYRFAILPIDEVIETFNRVAFPVYVKIADDRQRLIKAFKKNLSAVVGIALPISIIIFLFPGLITRVILGDQWLTIIPILRVMSLAGILVAIAAPPNALFLGTKHQSYLTLLTLIQLIILAITIIPFMIYYGVLGAVFAVIASLIISLPVRYYLVYNLLKPGTD